MEKKEEKREVIREAPEEEGWEGWKKMLRRYGWTEAVYKIMKK